jgi:hypothetical protein
MKLTRQLKNAKRFSKLCSLLCAKAVVVEMREPCGTIKPRVRKACIEASIPAGCISPLGMVLALARGAAERFSSIASFDGAYECCQNTAFLRRDISIF